MHLCVCVLYTALRLEQIQNKKGSLRQCCVSVGFCVPLFCIYGTCSCADFTLEMLRVKLWPALDLFKQTTEHRALTIALLQSLSISLSVCPCLCLSSHNICLSLCISVHVCLSCLTVYWLSDCLHISLFICPAVHLPLWLSVRLSVHLFTCLSVCLSV